MKIIKLDGVHYLSFKGITLTMNKPFVEATEENLNKLADYINSGFLIVKEKDKEDLEDQYKKVDMSMEEAMYEDYSEAEVERFPSSEELQAMTKKELFDILDKHHIKYQVAMKKEELIKLILA